MNNRKALLIGAYSAGERPVCEEHLKELAALADTYGLDPIRLEACPLRKINVTTYLGSGKVKELVALSQELEVAYIVFDEPIQPGQQRNLERLFSLPVINRAEVILGVFHDHARSREARLQVELAEAEYQLPRLKRLWTHLSRQRGGGVYQKGEGEKQLEIDRRLLEHRIVSVKEELIAVGKHRQVQRSARLRARLPTFAIVGYTNAGKSTLLNQLAQAGVLVEDKLFATLDTTTRRFTLPNRQEVLLIDTVGFIRKLPHSLVEAFKSTLEEVCYADVLLHIMDGSHPNVFEQEIASQEVLREVGADQHPCITVVNKVDQIEAATSRHFEKLRLENPQTVSISAKTGEGLDHLFELMEGAVAHLRRTVEVAIPQKEYALVSAVIREGEILEQEYEGNLIYLKAVVPLAIFEQIKGYCVV